MSSKKQCGCSTHEEHGCANLIHVVKSKKIPRYLHQIIITEGIISSKSSYICTGCFQFYRPTIDAHQGCYKH